MFSGWLFWSLTAALLWGVAQIVAKKGLAYFPPLWYNLTATILELPIFLPFGLSLGLNRARLSAANLLILVSIVSIYLLYYYAISLGKISLTGTIVSTYPLSAIFFSALFLGEKLTYLQLPAAVLIVGGVAVLGLPGKLTLRGQAKWFWLAVLSAFSIGFADFLAKFVLGEMGAGNYFFFYPLAFLPGLAVSYLIDKNGRRLPSVKPALFLYVLFGALIEVIGALFFFLAYERGPASLVTPVTSFYTVVTLILAAIFLREKLSLRQILGIGLAVLGIVFIGVRAG